MEDLLALADDDAVAGELLLRDALVDALDLLLVHNDAALLDEAAGLAAARAQPRGDKQREDVDAAVFKVGVREHGGRHIGAVAAGAEECLGRVLRLLCLLLAVDERGELVGKDLLGAVELAALPLVHLVDLLERQEGQHTDALQNVRVADVAPILVEVVGACLVRVEPHRAAGGLAHLLALAVHQQRDGHGVRVLAELPADQLRAAEHIAPLVVAAELHIAAVVLEEVIEVVGLHDHVVELKEAQALFHTLLVALGAEHIVDAEARAHLAQQLDVIEL